MRPHSFDTPLVTERLRLRVMTPADADDIHAYQSRADVCRYLLFEPRTYDEVAERLATHAAAVRLEGDGDYWQLAVELDGRVIGDLYFSIKSVADATGEIGWTLHPDFHGHGYMTEAAGAVLGLAFEKMDLNRVFADLDARNVGSTALCARLGMREEALFREHLWFKGEWADTRICAILRSEWEARVQRS